MFGRYIFLLNCKSWSRQADDLLFLEEIKMVGSILSSRVSRNSRRRLKKPISSVLAS